MVELRILWHSVAPFVYSGYGTVTRNVAMRLAEHYPLLISAYYGIDPGASIRIGNVRILPVSEENLGEYSVKHYIQKFRITLPILASDFWPFPWFAELPNAMFYGPVDSEDYSLTDVETMKKFTFFIPCSSFGAEVYRKLTKMKPTAIIPHGVDTSIFHPYPKEQCRALFNLPKKKFIFGIVAANSDPEPRKGWDDIFVALSQFKEKFPSETKNWLVFAFTKPSDKRGVDLVEMARRLDLEDNVLFPEHLAQIVGLPDPEMAKLYSCFDVLLNASRREGFCLPVLEAQACGVPVIASNISSLPELVQGHGWLVDAKETVFTPRGWICKRVDREDLLRKIEEAYFDASLRKRFSRKSIEFAKQYDWTQLVNTKWLPLLEELSSKTLNKLASN